MSCDNDPILVEQDPMDEMDDPINEIVISHTPDLYVGSISGKVVNENLEPLAEVNINVRGEEISTDENGYFNLRDIQLDAQGTLITASRENYWTITKLVVPSKAQQNQTRIMLRPKEELKIIEAVDGGMINFKDEVKIDFPANAFTTTDGDAYDGNVEIAVNYIDPTDENFGIMSPGDFRAFDAQSELQTLLSLGMAGVELKGANDVSLELKPDMAATLYIKVPDGTNAEEVPLWHLDEASGYWLEEGVARQEGDFYVGEVSHFSWWNCDLPFSAVKLSGTVVNNSGIGIGGLQVSIILEEDMWNLGAEYTGDRGLFCGWIPKDENLIIQIKDECGNIIFEDAIGAFSEDTNLSSIVIAGQNVIEVCGNLVDCNSELVSNGYLVVQHQGNKTFIPVDASGNFCSTVSICEATTFDLYGIDLSSGLQGLISTYDISDNPLGNLELSTCDQVASIFSYQIDNEPEILIVDFVISLDADGILGFGSSSEVHGIYPSVIIDGKNWGSPDFSFSYFNIGLASPTTEIDCDFFICDTPDIDIVEFGGVGNPIVLKIVGTSDEGNNYIINVSGILE